MKCGPHSSNWEIPWGLQSQWHYLPGVFSLMNWNNLSFKEEATNIRQIIYSYHKVEMYTCWPLHLTTHISRCIHRQFALIKQDMNHKNRSPWLKMAEDVKMYQIKRHDGIMGEEWISTRKVDLKTPWYDYYLSGEKGLLALVGNSVVKNAMRQFCMFHRSFPHSRTWKTSLRPPSESWWFDHQHNTEYHYHNGQLAMNNIMMSKS